MHALTRRLALFAAALVAGAAAQAQPFPNKPIRAVVPFAAGSATDQIGRAFAEKMSATLGQQIIIDNKPGANGMLGADSLEPLVAAAAEAGGGYLLGSATRVDSGISRPVESVNRRNTTSPSIFCSNRMGG